MYPAVSRLRPTPSPPTRPPSPPDQARIRPHSQLPSPIQLRESRFTTRRTDRFRPRPLHPVRIRARSRFRPQLRSKRSLPPPESPRAQWALLHTRSRGIENHLIAQTRMPSQLARAFLTYKGRWAVSGHRFSDPANREEANRLQAVKISIRLDSHPVQTPEIHPTAATFSVALLPNCDHTQRGRGRSCIAKRGRPASAQSPIDTPRTSLQDSRPGPQLATPAAAFDRNG